MTGLWWYANKNWLPQPAPVTKKAEEPAKPDADRPTPEAFAAVAGGTSFVAPPPAPTPPPKADVPPEPPPEPPKPEVKTPYQPARLIALGGPHFNNRALLTTHGGAVQQIGIPGFDEATRIGTAAVGPDGRRVALNLVPGIYEPHGLSLKDDPPLPDLQPGPTLDPLDPATPPSQRVNEPSYPIFLYPSEDANYPDPHLGTTPWDVVEESRPADGPHKVVFETTLPAPYFLTIRKTYTLAPKDYHIGLRVTFTRTGGEKGKGKFRYQVAGPRGLPVDGEWYTAVQRVGLVGWRTEKGALKRDYQTAAEVTNQRGSDKVERGGNTFQYAAVMTQFFASALAIDPTGGAAPDPWAYVRITSELPVIPPPDEFKKLEEELKANPEDLILRARVERIRVYRDRKMPQFDDITFRAVSPVLDPAPGETITHQYAIYNGPAKVRLLNLLEGDRAVPEGVVATYHDTFGLGTLTDYHSPTAIGRFADAIYWSDLVIVFTNLMHGVLWGIHQVVPYWGLCIIILTVFVKLLLFIPSRKQTQMNMKMVEVQKKMKPELEKLQEKYKDDAHTYNREKTRLMMQHGFNPFGMMGGCLLLVLQMPIFMGLYFCLQESVFFRLEPFLWMDNLAAPDMTVWWTENIPVVSDPENRYGTWSLVYLGPFLNILPLVAVALMLYQQTKMMPPPTDDQMAAQQKMMKFMMIAIAVMFYKVAAGLALYFTISTLWGIIERQVIPKPKIDTTEPPPGDGPRGGGSANGPPPPPKPKGFLGRFRARLMERMEELQKQAAEQSSRQVKNNPGGPTRPDPARTPPRRDKKKRRK